MFLKVPSPGQWTQLHRCKAKCSKCRWRSCRTKCPRIHFITRSPSSLQSWSWQMDLLPLVSIWEIFISTTPWIIYMIFLLPPLLPYTWQLFSHMCGAAGKIAVVESGMTFSFNISSTTTTATRMSGIKIPCDHSCCLCPVPSSVPANISHPDPPTTPRLPVVHRLYP